MSLHPLVVELGAFVRQLFPVLVGDQRYLPAFLEKVMFPGNSATDLPSSVVDS